jgi:hypothetical protein
MTEQSSRRIIGIFDAVLLLSTPIFAIPPHQSFATTPTVTVTVSSADLSGASFNGMWMELHDSTGKILTTGYTPITFTVTPGVQYSVNASDYGNTVFNHWTNGTTNRLLTITPTNNLSLTAFYSTTPPTPTPTPIPTQVTISVNSVDLSGKPITGMWTVLRYTNGTTITSGYTPVSFKVMSGTTYVVHVGNYGTTIFDHWNNGSTSSYYAITPTQNVTLTAYYRTL